jgi:hypothetical protein
MVASPRYALLRELMVLPDSPMATPTRAVYAYGTHCRTCLYAVTTAVLRSACLLQMPLLGHRGDPVVLAALARGSAINSCLASCRAEPPAPLLLHARRARVPLELPLRACALPEQIWLPGDKQRALELGALEFGVATDLLHRLGGRPC